MTGLNKILTSTAILMLTLTSSIKANENQAHSAIKDDKEELAEFLSKNYKNEAENPSIHKFASTMMSSLGCPNYINTAWREGKNLAIAEAESFNDPDKILSYYTDAGINLFGESFQRSGKSIIKTISKLHKLFSFDVEKEFNIKGKDLPAFFAQLESKGSAKYTWSERGFVREFYALSRELNELSESLGIPCDKKLRRPLLEKDPEDRAHWGKNSSEVVVDDPMSYARQSSSCRQTIPRNVRAFAYEHFTRFLRSKIRKGEKVTSDELDLFARRTSYIMIESYRGFSTTVTDMSYRGTGSKPFKKENPKGIPIISWLLGGTKITERDHVSTSLKSWRDALNIDNMKEVSINKQTNYGILQMSADRLTFPKTGLIFQRQIDSLKQAAINNPDALLDFCQTEKFFKDSRSDLINAFKGISSCQASTKSESGVKCFGAWAMLCPGFNMDMGLAAPIEYFASDTRKKAPEVCEEAFKSILDQYRSSFPSSGI